MSPRQLGGSHKNNNGALEAQPAMERVGHPVHTAARGLPTPTALAPVFYALGGLLRGLRLGLTRGHIDWHVCNVGVARGVKFSPEREGGRAARDGRRGRS